MYVGRNPAMSTTIWQNSSCLHLCLHVAYMLVCIHRRVYTLCTQCVHSVYTACTQRVHTLYTQPHAVCCLNRKLFSEISRTFMIVYVYVYVRVYVCVSVCLCVCVSVYSHVCYYLFIWCLCMSACTFLFQKE